MPYTLAQAKIDWDVIFDVVIDQKKQPKDIPIGALQTFEYYMTTEQEHAQVAGMFNHLFTAVLQRKKEYSLEFIEALITAWANLAPTLKTTGIVENRLIKKINQYMGGLLPRLHEQRDSLCRLLPCLLSMTGEIGFDVHCLSMLHSPPAAAGMAEAVAMQQGSSGFTAVAVCDPKLAKGGYAMDDDFDQDQRLQAMIDTLRAQGIGVQQDCSLPYHWQELCNVLEDDMSMADVFVLYSKIPIDDPILALMLKTHSDVYLKEWMIYSRLAKFEPLCVARDDVLATPSSFRMLVSGFHSYLKNRDSNALFITPPSHHASKQTASGFCAGNLVAASVLDTSEEEEVLIIGFDVNQDDGTREILLDFARSGMPIPDVTHVDIFDRNVFPAGDLPKEHVSFQASDDGCYHYRPILLDGVKAAKSDIMQKVLDIIAAFMGNGSGKRKRIIFSAGYDSHQNDSSFPVDPLHPGHRFNDVDFARLNATIKETIVSQKATIQVFTEGGYNRDVLTSLLSLLANAMQGEAVNRKHSLPKASASHATMNGRCRAKRIRLSFARGSEDEDGGGDTVAAAQSYSRDCPYKCVNVNN